MLGLVSLKLSFANGLNFRIYASPYLSLAIDKHTVNFEYRMSNGYMALDRRTQNTVLLETWRMPFSSKLYDHTGYIRRPQGCQRFLDAVVSSCTFVKDSALEKFKSSA